eukprot:SM000161S02420  [mRNA]  locus=s161:176241:179213:+ [translate_table: standard]
MALQNIGEGNRDDAFYRYKMPRLVTKIEGRGNGIKTNVVNMVDVAKALARPPSYTTKYFGCVLGAMSKFDDKTGTSTVNGAHDTPKLASLLENFIKKYVQCYGCGNPETEIIIDKQQMIHLKCAACGFLSDVDMRDKLNTFILNNPPEDKKSGSKKDKQAWLRRAEKERLKAGELADEADKKAKGAIKKKKGEAEKPKKKTKEDEEAISPEASQHDDEEVGGADEDEVQWQTDTSAAAAEKRIQEQLTQATSEMVMMDIVNGEVLKRSASSGNDSSASTPRPTDASANNSADKSRNTTPRVAITPKAEDYQTEVANNGMEDEDEDDDDEEATEAPELDAVSIHDRIVREFRDYAASHTAAEISAYVMKKAAPKQEVLMALFEALFGGVAKGLSVEVAKKSALFGKLVSDAHDQMHLLQIIEKYCGVIELAAIKETALVIKVFYDADVLEEEQVLQWFDHKEAQTEFGIDAKAAAAVRKQAAPFVDWLRTAEADSEGSEE